VLDSFTDQSRIVLRNAQDEARRLGQDFTEAEHLLLALIGDETGAGAQLLAALGADPGRLATEITERSPARAALESRRPPFSAELNEILALFAAEANGPRCGYIGPSHLLFAVMAEDRGRATGALEAAGMDVGAARAQVLASLNG